MRISGRNTRRVDINKMKTRTAYLTANKVYAVYDEARQHGPLEPEGFFEDWMYDNASWCSRQFYDNTFALFLKLMQLNSGKSPRRQRG